MSSRKPLDPKCDGGILCPVDDHVITQRIGFNTQVRKHIKLTRGQVKTLSERRYEAFLKKEASEQ